jgi:hypothetical protein
VNFDTFFKIAKHEGLKPSFGNPQAEVHFRLSNEALFHLPLLAITVLALAKDRRKPTVDELGQLVGECFERTFVGFKGSSQHLGWSANLRVRTVRALTFLEAARLVSVNRLDNRISISPTGRKVIDRALDKEDSQLAYVLRVIERSYRNVNAEQQVSLKF